MDYTEVTETKKDSYPRAIPPSQMETADLPPSKASLLLPALLLLVIGGVVGFFIGRQSVAQPIVERAAYPVAAATTDGGQITTR